jgi:hypothetical protein
MQTHFLPWKQELKMQRRKKADKKPYHTYGLINLNKTISQ